MCELCPQWVVKKDFTRKHDDFRGTSFNSGIKKEMGNSLDKCDHISVSRLGNGNFFCHNCEEELQLIQINVK